MQPHLSATETSTSQQAAEQDLGSLDSKSYIMITKQTASLSTNGTHRAPVRHMAMHSSYTQSGSLDTQQTQVLSRGKQLLLWTVPKLQASCLRCDAGTPSVQGEALSSGEGPQLYHEQT